MLLLQRKLLAVITKEVTCCYYKGRVSSFQCFKDLDANHIVEHDQIKQGKFLGKGSYGDVFMAELLVENNNNKTTTLKIAMKIPMNSEKEKNRQLMATMFSYDTYR